MNVIIRDALSKQHKSKGSLAKVLNISRSAVTELLAGRRKIRIDELPKIVRYLELDHIPVVGRIGTGGAIEQVGELSEGYVELPCFPPVGAGELLAFEVTGNSMMPRYDAGDAIVVRVEKQPIKNFYGQEVVV